MSNSRGIHKVEFYMAFLFNQQNLPIVCSDLNFLPGLAKMVRYGQDMDKVLVRKSN